MHRQDRHNKKPKLQQYLFERTHPRPGVTAGMHLWAMVISLKSFAPILCRMKSTPKGVSLPLSLEVGQSRATLQDQSGILCGILRAILGWGLRKCTAVLSGGVPGSAEFSRGGGTLGVLGDCVRLWDSLGHAEILGHAGFKDAECFCGIFGGALRGLGHPRDTLDSLQASLGVGNVGNAGTLGEILGGILCGLRYATGLFAGQYSAGPPPTPPPTPPPLQPPPTPIPTPPPPPPPQPPRVLGSTGVSTAGDALHSPNTPKA